VILAGKRLLITGVITKDSIAFHAAEHAQREGATVLLTSFGRVRRLTERAARRLSEPVDVLELDVNQESDLSALTEELRGRWGGVDGVLHAIAYAPEDALGGRFMTAPAESAGQAFQTSAFSLKALAAALQPLMGPGGSIVGLDFDASVAWPIYDWMGVAKAALESVSRYLARDLGPSGIRVNLVSAGSRRREPGRPVARPGPAGLGRERPRSRRQRDLFSVLRSRPRDQRRDPACRRRVPCDWGAGVWFQLSLLWTPSEWGACPAYAAAHGALARH
jgi:enoyl-[acyl-carrier-protein] reductase (NADH)